MEFAAASLDAIREVFGSGPIDVYQDLCSGTCDILEIASID
jgi:hypothetical protein